MSDASEYFIAHAREALRQARACPRGPWRDRKRLVGRIYHAMARQTSPAATVASVHAFRRNLGRDEARRPG